MTIRDLLGVLVKAADLDRDVTVRTYDGAELGAIAFADLVSLAGTNTAERPALVLSLYAGTVAEVARDQAIMMADGDPLTLEKLRDAGVIEREALQALTGLRNKPRVGCPDLDPGWPDHERGDRPRGPRLCVLYPDCKCGEEDRAMGRPFAKPDRRGRVKVTDD